MRQKCTRSRLRALSLLLIIASGTVHACALDRFYRLQTTQRCITDCVFASQHGAENLYTYPAITSVTREVVQVSRSALKRIELPGLSPPIPISSVEAVRMMSGAQLGCRLVEIGHGSELGIRPGMAVNLRLFTGGFVRLYVLQSGDGKALGVYDVTHITME